MKKSLIFTALILVCFNLNAQDESTKFSGENSYGVKAGFTSFNIKASTSGVSVSEDASGFYVGFFASFSLSEKFEVQPELHVLSVYESGENLWGNKCGNFPTGQARKPRKKKKDGPDIVNNMHKIHKVKKPIWR